MRSRARWRSLSGPSLCRLSTSTCWSSCPQPRVPYLASMESIDGLRSGATRLKTDMSWSRACPPSSFPPRTPWPARPSRTQLRWTSRESRCGLFDPSTWSDHSPPRPCSSSSTKEKAPSIEAIRRSPCPRRFGWSWSCSESCFHSSRVAGPFAPGRGRGRSRRAPRGSACAPGTSGRRRSSTWRPSVSSCSRRSWAPACSRCVPPPGRARRSCGRWGRRSRRSSSQRCMELPEQQVVPAGLEIIDRPDATFAPGDPMHLRLSLRAPSRIALVEEPPGGPVVQAWPGLSQAPALIPRPSSGGPAVQRVALDAPAEPGAHRLRLVVAPADLDLGALSPAALREAAGAADARRSALPGAPVRPLHTQFANPRRPSCVMTREAGEMP